MIYISPENEYPRHIGDIQISNPSYKAGQPLPAGWVKVEESDRPAVTNTQIVYEDFPTEVNGVMTQNWVVREMTAEELERKNAPTTAKEKLMALGLTEAEISALVRGMVR